MAEQTNRKKAERFVKFRFPKAFGVNALDVDQPNLQWKIWLHIKFQRPIVSNSDGDEDQAWIDAAEALGWQGMIRGRE